MTTRLRIGGIGAVVLLGVGLGLGAVEVLLRMDGYSPRRVLDRPARDPLMYQPDAELGWDVKPGRYVMPAYRANARDAAVTLLTDRSRTTGSSAGDGVPVVAFLGCSFTFGAAIPDEKTFPWLIQQRFPSLQILNFGRGGYGTYQSLLLMERILAGPIRPRVFIYGLAEFHASRNVADASWLRALDLFSQKGLVETPYATLGDGGHLVRHPPIHNPHWPLRSQLSTVAFLEEGYIERTAGSRAVQALPVTKQVLLEMDEVARRHRAEFAVVLLHATPEGAARYSEFLQRHGIVVIDCTLALRPALQVPGDGHPNGRANRRWAKCIRDNMHVVIGALR